MLTWERHGQYSCNIEIADSGGKFAAVIEYAIQGLALPKEVLDKLLFENYVKWFPWIERDC